MSIIVDNPVDNLWKSCGKISSRTYNTLFFCFFLFFGKLPLTAQVELSQLSYISLLTCDQGSDLYASFGHTCFRVFDPANGINEVYNYGTFNFQTPGFYQKFVQGKLNYMLSVDDYQRFRYWYMANKRSVQEQIFRLNQEQKQAFYNYLYENNRPENRYYLYDYFFKNCSSVPRDIIFEVMGDEWLIDSAVYEPGELSFRELISEKLVHTPWSKFGIDLILGMKIDRKVSRFEQMFLPDQLMDYLDEAKMEVGGRRLSFISDKQQTVFGEKLPPYNGLTPLVVCWTIFGLIALFTVLQYFWGWKSRLLDIILFSLAGLAGIAMLIMWFGTDHSTTSSNLNVIWALPTHLVAAVLLGMGKRTSILGTYFMISSLVLGLFLLSHSFLPQTFNAAFIPLILGLFLRSIFLWNKQT